MFNEPTYFITPNEFVDVYLKTLTGAETQILLVIMRKTFGFHKEFDYLSISKLMEYTGLSNRTAMDSTASLAKKDLIVIHYQCANCKTTFNAVDTMLSDNPYSYQKNGETRQFVGHKFLCNTCQSQEHPNKLFSLSMDEKCSEVLINFHRGSEISSQQVVKKVHNGSEISSQLGGEISSHTKRNSIQKETDIKETSTKEEVVSEVLTSTYNVKPVHSNDESPSFNSEQYDIDMEKSNRVRKIFEKEYNSQFFLNGALTSMQTKAKYNQILEYPEDQIIEAVKKKSEGTNIKTERYLISNVLEELQKSQSNSEVQTEQPPRVATFVKSPRERAWIELINVPDWAYMSDFVETGKIPERQFATICTVLRTFFDHLENFEGFADDYEKKYPGNIDTMKDMLTYINRKESEGNTDDSN